MTVGNAVANRVAFGYRDHLSAAARAYRSDERGHRSVERLGRLRDAFVGERCFIIGNGPSLAATDLSALGHERTFGLNRGYLLSDRIGAPTTFLVAVNRHVIDQFGAEIIASQSQKFVSWHSRDLVPEGADVTFVRDAIGPRFCENVATQGAWEGATVTYVALQLAYHMGFSEVILIGVDHSFSARGEPHSLVVSQGPDLNHFDPSYFGAGVRWQLPDLETSEVAFRLARQHFERAGREVVDATIGGRLEVFRKVDYPGIAREAGHPGRP
jgi:hypothetical protein